jgi:hypothetical protein
MATRNMLRICVLTAALVVAFVGPRNASAAAPANYNVSVAAVVPNGLAPNDLHLIFTGTGGTIKNEVLVSPAGQIQVNNGDQVDITLNAKAAAGDTIKIKFTSQHPEVAFDSGTWTNDNNPIGTVDAQAVTTVVVPGASSATLIALAALMLGAGALALRRRRDQMA